MAIDEVTTGTEAMSRAAAEQQLRMRIAGNIRRYRRAARLTLKVASERANMHWRHWQKVEAGTINLSLSTLCRFSAVLGVDAEDLFAVPPVDSSALN